MAQQVKNPPGMHAPAGRTDEPLLARPPPTWRELGPAWTGGAVVGWALSSPWRAKPACRASLSYLRTIIFPTSFAFFQIKLLTLLLLNSGGKSARH